MGSNHGLLHCGRASKLLDHEVKLQSQHYDDASDTALILINVESLQNGLQLFSMRAVTNVLATLKSGVNGQ